MNEQKKKEIIYVAGTIVSILFAVLGFSLVLAMIIPTPGIEKDEDYYVVGIVTSLLFWGLFLILFNWSKNQLRKY